MRKEMVFKCLRNRYLLMAWVALAVLALSSQAGPGAWAHFQSVQLHDCSGCESGGSTDQNTCPGHGTCAHCGPTGKMLLVAFTTSYPAPAAGRTLTFCWVTFGPEGFPPGIEHPPQLS